MNGSFEKNRSHNFSRLLTLVAVILVFAMMLSACQKKETPAEATQDQTPPNLIEETKPVETQAPTTPPTEAAPDNIAIALTQMNVRSSPSNEGNVISQLDAGEEVTINRIESINGVEWAYIPLKGWVTTENLDMSGVTGVVSNISTPANPDNTEPPPPTEAPKPVELENNNNQNANVNVGNGKKGVVTGSALNIRSQPNTDSDIVGTLGYGDRVAIEESSNGWGKTSKGWINLNYVYIDGSRGANACKGLITGTGLNVRGGPGTNYDAVTTYPQLTRVEIFEQLKVGNITWGCTKDGWIAMDYVYVDGTTGNGAGTGTVTADAVNIRSGPGTTFDAVSSANTGDSVRILAQFTIGDMTWGCTEKGWISMNYVNMNG